MRCEIEVAAGLEGIVKDELTEKLASQDLMHIRVQPGAVGFAYAGALAHLLRLKTANAVYLLHTYPVPRPKALLGHEHFHHMLKLIEAARQVVGRQAYHTMYLSAAGSDSSVMMRLKAELSGCIGLPFADDTGDLLIRVRRAEAGWDVLVRLSPRPSATRDWRICSMEGALNGPVAQAMLRLAGAAPDDRCLNLMCGSGGLMIERALHSPARHIIGCDIDTSALNCAARNIAAAGCAGQVLLLRADAQKTPFAAGMFNRLYADLPFGQRVGSHTENLSLYPAVLKEAGRVAQDGAHFVLITHEVRLMEDLLRKAQMWHTEQVIRVTLRGLHPRIFLLRKKS